MSHSIESGIVESVRVWDRTPRQVGSHFDALLADGARIVVAGTAQRNPRRLLLREYRPRYAFELFDTLFFMAEARQNVDIRFCVAYVGQRPKPQSALRIYPRIFYKDVSLVWRSASHFIHSDGENWIGKGDVKTRFENDEEIEESCEETSDLPLEIQTALETLNRKPRKVRTDEKAVALVLKRAPDWRIEPYRDFTEPRRLARENPRNLINRGRSIARFRRKNDPSSLTITRGFEPDFAKGVIERAESSSSLYGGGLVRVRILSRNRKVQYLFFGGPRLVWIGSCQATTTELSSFGVRTVDVETDDDLLIPGYEYHFLDDSEDPPVFVSQIPEGYAGAPSAVDSYRADASPWLDKIPVIREFRRKVLSGK